MLTNTFRYSTCGTANAYILKGTICTFSMETPLTGVCLVVAVGLTQRDHTGPHGIIFILPRGGIGGAHGDIRISHVTHT